MRYRSIVGINEGDASDLVYTYSSSLAHDRYIKHYVLEILKAHTLHLASKSIIPPTVAEKVVEALGILEDEPLPSSGYEDVFEWVEDKLEEITGGESRWIWIGRSRNDHVSAALRLYTRDKLEESISLTGKILEAINKLALEENSETLIPLFTHRIPSQIGTIGCLLEAWKQAVETGKTLLQAAHNLVNRGPLGAGAGAGTLASIDPGELNASLGFRETLKSTIYAAGSRMDLAAAVDAASLILAELARIAADIITYQSPPYNIMSLPARHIATSSIMPHKKNPVTLEALIGKAKRVIGCSAAFKSIMAGLPSGYSLDLQEANPCLYEAMETLTSSLAVMADVLEGLRIDVRRAEEAALETGAWSAELAEYMSLREGIPLREAYKLALKQLGKIENPRELLAHRKTGCKVPIKP